MSKSLENVKQAKESFNRILDNKKYADIIKDDQHLNALLSLIEDGEYRSILDIGTGTGYLAFPLAEKFQSAKVYGIDIAETIIQKNIKMVKEKGIENLVFQAFDGFHYPFADDSFDLIVTRYAFHHFANVEDIIQQMNRLLVRGGKVLVSDPMRNVRDSKGIIDDFMKVKKDGHIQFYASGELDALFEHQGFIKAKQIVTHMQFPFAKNEEYIKIYDQSTEKERQLYNIVNDDGIIWVRHIDVGNTVFIKQ